VLDRDKVFTSSF
jgi:hypothetical protein